MDIEEQLNYVVNRMKIVRVNKGISQMELSLRSNLSQSFIANIEKGKKQPSVLTLIRIANALDVNPHDFFMETHIPHTKEKIKEQIYKLIELL